MRPIVLLSVLLFLSCTSYRYVLVSDSDFNSLRNSNDVRYKRYVLLDTVLTQMPELQTPIYLLKKNDLAGLRKHIESNPSKSSDEYFLSSALLKLWQENYYEAREDLSKVTGSVFDCVKLLLMTDCEYKLDATNNSKLFNNYQKALDCNYNDNTRDIIEIRTKLVKYDEP